MNSKVGIEGVAKLVVDALIKAQSTGPLMIGGYSVGCYVAFEMSRQLAQAGRQVTGLLLIDMPCPRPRGVDQGKMLAEGEASEAVLEGIVNRDGQWSALGSRREHMRQFFVAMNEYSPARMTATERPAKTAVIWAEHGLINRVVDDPAQIQKLEAQGVPTKPYPGFMQDPKLGTFACHVPNKGQENLGPNGWDEYTGGDVKVLSVNGDHFELPMPGHVHLLQEKMEDALAYFSST
jgi:thioesterase domain-containing protein